MHIGTHTSARLVIEHDSIYIINRNVNIDSLFTLIELVHHFTVDLSR